MGHLEFLLLDHILARAEQEGALVQNTIFDVDEGLVADIHGRSLVHVSLVDLRATCDRCLTHEWIAHRLIGDRYGGLALTTRGKGAVLSRRHTIAEEKAKGFWRRMSEKAEDHKGIIAVGTFIVALITAVITYLVAK